LSSDCTPPASATAHGTRDARFHFALWCLTALVVLFATVTVSVRNPWQPDELRYGVVAKQMKAAGTMLEPRLWGELYIEKPPTFFWLVLAGSTVFGEVGLPALLAPAVIAACLGLWLVARAAARWYGEQVGMTAAAVLVTLPLYFFCSSYGRMDMPFSLAITAATIWFHRGYVDERRWAKLATFVAMGVAVLIKGPLGVLLPIAIGVTILALTGRLRRLAAWETLVGVLLFSGVLAAWLGPAIVRLGPQYLERLLERHLLVAAVEGQHHPGSLFFYLPVLPAVLLPWSIFALPAARSAWRRWRVERDDAALWLMCWLAVPFIVLSLVRQKLHVYLLPMMPPFAILIARYWTELHAVPHAARQARRQALILLTAASVLCAVIATAGWMIPHHGPDSPLRNLDPDRLIGLLAAPHVLMVGGGSLAACGLIGGLTLLMSRRDVERRTLCAVSVLPVATLIVVTVVIFPALDARQSWCAVAEAIGAERMPGEAVVTYRMSPYIGFYLNEPVPWLKRPPMLEQFMTEHASVLSAVPCDKMREVKELCDVQFDPDRVLPSPKGPVYIVRLQRRSPRDAEPSGPPSLTGVVELDDGPGRERTATLESVPVVSGIDLDSTRKF